MLIQVWQEHPAYRTLQDTDRSTASLKLTLLNRLGEDSEAFLSRMESQTPSFDEPQRLLRRDTHEETVANLYTFIRDGLEQSGWGVSLEAVHRDALIAFVSATLPEMWLQYFAEILKSGNDAIATNARNTMHLFYLDSLTVSINQVQQDSTETRKMVAQLQHFVTEQRKQPEPSLWIVSLDPVMDSLKSLRGDVQRLGEQLADANITDPYNVAGLSNPYLGLQPFTYAEPVALAACADR
jgi:hypothetical protein